MSSCPWLSLPARDLEETYNIAAIFWGWSSTSLQVYSGQDLVGPEGKGEGGGLGSGREKTRLATVFPRSVGWRASRVPQSCFQKSGWFLLWGSPHPCYARRLRKFLDDIGVDIGRGDNPVAKGCPCGQRQANRGEKGKAARRATGRPWARKKTSLIIG